MVQAVAGAIDIRDWWPYGFLGPYKTDYLSVNYTLMASYSVGAYPAMSNVIGATVQFHNPGWPAGTYNNVGAATVGGANGRLAVSGAFGWNLPDSSNPMRLVLTRSGGLPDIISDDMIPAQSLSFTALIHYVHLGPGNVNMQTGVSDQNVLVQETYTVTVPLFFSFGGVKSAGDPAGFISTNVHVSATMNVSGVPAGLGLTAKLDVVGDNGAVLLSLPAGAVVNGGLNVQGTVPFSGDASAGIMSVRWTVLNAAGEIVLQTPVDSTPHVIGDVLSILPFSMAAGAGTYGATGSVSGDDLNKFSLTPWSGAGADGLSSGPGSKWSATASLGGATATLTGGYTASGGFSGGSASGGAGAGLSGGVPTVAALPEMGLADVTSNGVQKATAYTTNKTANVVVLTNGTVLAAGSDGTLQQVNPANLQTNSSGGITADVPYVDSSYEDDFPDMTTLVPGEIANATARKQLSLNQDAYRHAWLNTLPSAAPSLGSVGGSVNNIDVQFGKYPMHINIAPEGCQDIRLINLWAMMIAYWAATARLIFKFHRGGI